MRAGPGTRPAEPAVRSEVAAREGVTALRDDRRAAALLLALPFVVFGRALMPGRVLSPADNLLTAWPWKSIAPDAVPANPLLADVSTQLHPWLIYAGREIADGRFPLWNPHAFGGAPFLGAAQSQLLFPLSVLAYVLPPTIALTLIAMLKCALAGLAMYWFLRGLAVAVPAALLGGLAFMWSAAIVVWLHTAFANGLALVPAVLGAIHRLHARGGAPWIAMTAMAIALVILGGYPQGLLYTILMAVAWAVTLAPGAPRGAWRFLASVGAAIALGLVVGAVQIIPFVEYLRESAVAAYRAEWVPFMRLPGRAIVTLFLPQFYGTPGGRDYWGPFNFHAIAIAVGVVPWVVLPAAVVAARRHRAAAFFVALAVFSAAMLYGAPGARILAEIPPFSMTGNLRFGVLFVIALAVLAGLGADVIARVDPMRRRHVAYLIRAGVAVAAALPLFFVVTALLTMPREATRASLAVQYAWWLIVLVVGGVFALCWLRDGRMRWAIGLAAVQLASTLPLGATYNPVVETRFFYPEPPVLGALRAATTRDGSRVLTGANNVSMLYGLSEPTGYDALTPRHIEAVAGPIGAARTLGLLGTEPLTAGAVFASPALDLMAVRHLLVPPGMSPGERFTLEYDGADARVYRNDGALPRAMLVPRGRCVGDAEAIRLIRERRVDFRRDVLLAPPCEATPVAESNVGAGRATIRDVGSNVVVVDVATETPAYLVLADTWFPGWGATVGGAPATILRANHAFRAVRLERGAHLVRFEYRPGSVRLGLLATVTGTVIVAALLVIGGRRREP